MLISILPPTEGRLLAIREAAKRSARGVFAVAFPAVFACLVGVVLAVDGLRPLPAPPKLGRFIVSVDIKESGVYKKVAEMSFLALAATINLIRARHKKQQKGQEGAG